jgi:uncharacterized membrane protein
MTDPNPEGNPAELRRRAYWSGLLIGVGIAAFVDEVVFHQLLSWHHFYDKSTTEVGIFSDGLFHAFGWFAMVTGLVLLADLRRRRSLPSRLVLAAALLGAGAFQLLDGVVAHKLLRIHQIRYNTGITPYDLVWNIVAVLLIAVGGIVLSRFRTGVPAEGNRRSGNRATR